MTKEPEDEWISSEKHVYYAPIFGYVNDGFNFTN